MLDELYSDNTEEQPIENNTLEDTEQNENGEDLEQIEGEKPQYDLSTPYGRLMKRISVVQPKEPELQFTEEELEMFLEEAVLEHTSGASLENLPEEEEYLVAWLAMSNAYYQLAGRTADHIRFRVQNDEYHAQTVPLNYMRIAQAMEKKYKENKNIEVNTLTRRQTGTGLYSPYYPGDRP